METAGTGPRPTADLDETKMTTPPRKIKLRRNAVEIAAENHARSPAKRRKN